MGSRLCGNDTLVVCVHLSTTRRGSAVKPTTTDPLIPTVCALGIAQITAWGTSYYVVGILALPMAADTGWSRTMIYLGFTVAMLAMGTVSAWAGRLIDRRGARLTMCVGTVLTAAGLFLLSLVQSEAAYLALWALLGVGMRLTLYDAAFAALVQVVPSRGREAISYLTLFGAFASTVFWVVGHYFNEAFGWRGTLVAFAIIHLAVCLPLNWWGLSRREAPGLSTTPAAEARSARDGPPLTGRVRTLAMLLFALVMSMNGYIFGVVAVHLVPLFEAAGLTVATAVWIASMKGVAQFSGRLIEIVFGKNLRAMTVARIALGVLPISFIVLWFAGGDWRAILVFTLVMGAAQGVITIVRGAVPLALFGKEGYGAVLGLVATPIVIINAVSPTVFALTVDRWGWRAAEMSLLSVAVVSCVAMEMMSRWYERRRGGVK
ncbi:MAG: MFS transporter [Betaproteobacteria bacterium]|nr:MFS transporter [Betaproteobacteria bacterium]